MNNTTQNTNNLQKANNLSAEKKMHSIARKNELEEIKMRQIGERLASTSISIIIAIVLIFGAGKKFSENNARWFQFTNSLQQNDNSENYSNHHYGKDMLKTTEPNSFLITEGGDNQVFGLLYFGLAEHMRPDVDFFDQKGNVFPRLYGDFIGFHPYEVELIRFLRDFQIYSTNRPVYLTWKRDEMHLMHLPGIAEKKEQLINRLNLKLINANTTNNEKLFYSRLKDIISTKYQVNNLLALKYTTENMISKEVYSGKLRSSGNLFTQAYKNFGPWYLKQTGLLYKVAPFHYAFADILFDFGGSMPIERLFTITENRTKISSNTFNYNSYLSKLSKEGYVTINKQKKLVSLNKEVTFFNNPEKKTGMRNIDYWESYNFSFLEIPNATQWEPLSRQIFGNYLTSYADVLTQYSANLRLYANKEKLKHANSKEAEAMLEKSFQYSESAYFYNSKILNFSQDRPSYLKHVAQIFLERKEYLKAINALILAAKADPQFSSSISKANAIALKNIYPNLSSKEEKIKLLKNVIASHYFQIERRKIYLHTTGLEFNKINSDEEIIEVNAKIESVLKLLNTL